MKNTLSLSLKDMVVCFYVGVRWGLGTQLESGQFSASGSSGAAAKQLAEHPPPMCDHRLRKLISKYG